jgi:ribosomal protein S20
MRGASKMAKAEKDPQKIEEGRKSFARAVDKAAGKKVIHKNKAARLKSRLARSIKSG